MNSKNLNDYYFETIDSSEIKVDNFNSGLGIINSHYSNKNNPLKATVLKLWHV